ncbi:hypothetical protein A9Q84_16745 [Halobacteriovorax marinus]|uniref:HTH araC/xylS-type domain-containing protein n=1 Tax=Halobacteriovorax marinus TaxID=97084 RepID=A0A1Y5F8G5_9BACT|nr:hypothetical protein A9Q84_16745 [Halobacteriovorax marinus]
MKKGIDLFKQFPEIKVVHHNLPGKTLKKEGEGIHRLIIPISGQVKVRTNGKTYSFGPSKMIYIPSHSSHEFDSSKKGSGERIVALIQDSFWKKISKKTHEATLLNVSTLLKELLLHLLLHSDTTYHKAFSATVINVTSDLIETIGDDISNIEHLYAKTTDERLKSALDYIKENTKLKLELKDLSIASGMSSRNLNRLFSQTFSINPKQLHHKLRMDCAYKLLKSKHMNVTETCFEVGFSSLSQFTKAFKKTIGKLPSEV